MHQGSSQRNFRQITSSQMSRAVSYSSHTREINYILYSSVVLTCHYGRVACTAPRSGRVASESALRYKLVRSLWTTMSRSHGMQWSELWIAERQVCGPTVGHGSRSSGVDTLTHRGFRRTRWIPVLCLDCCENFIVSREPSRDEERGGDYKGCDPH